MRPCTLSIAVLLAGCTKDPDPIDPGDTQAPTAADDSDETGAPPESGGGDTGATFPCVFGADIQPAIDAAPPGDTVWICAGTHRVNLVVASEVVLAGTVVDATLDGQGLGPTIEAHPGAALIVRSLRVTGGAGSGIDAAAAVALVVEHTTISGNTGAGLRGPTAPGTEAVLTDVQLTGNTAAPTADDTADTGSDTPSAYGGGAVLLRATLTGVTVALNTADVGAGVHVLAGGVVVADPATVIRENEAAISGGGLALDANAQWSGGEVTDNTAPSGAGVHLRGGGQKLVDVAITRNHGGAGGGLRGPCCGDTGGTVTLDGVEIRANTAAMGAGILWSERDLVLRAVSVFANDADAFGGGLYVLGGAPDLTVDIRDKSTIGSNSANLGAGIALDGGTVSVTDSAVCANIAYPFGGGAWITSGFLTSVNGAWCEGGNDNRPDDLYVGFMSYRYGNGASFTCGPTVPGCVP